MREKLQEIRDPFLEKVQAHLFWSGLRDGSLPVAALARFIEQDTAFLLPAYARALARCAAAAPADEDTLLLAGSVTGTLEAAERLRRSAAELAARLGLPEPERRPTLSPTTLAHTSFLAAATAGSFHAGLGALLPMVWFNAEVSDALLKGVLPGSRYEPWIEAYHPGEGYGYAVTAFLDLAERSVENGSSRQRRSIIEQFSIGCRYELAFAESCSGGPSAISGAIPFEEPTREGATT